MVLMRIGLLLSILLVSSMAKNNWSSSKLPDDVINDIDLVMKDKLSKDNKLDKEKLNSLRNILQNQNDDNFIYACAHTIDEIYSASFWNKRDKRALVELSIYYIIQQNKSFTKKKVRDSYYDLLNTAEVGDDVIYELIRKSSSVVNSVEHNDVNQIKHHFKELRKIANNKTRSTEVRSLVYRELSTIPFRENLLEILDGLKDKDIETIEGIGSGLKKYIRKSANFELTDKFQKKSDLNMISDHIISFLENRQKILYVDKFLFVPLGLTKTPESKKWLINRLRKDNYSDYSFILPALKGRLEEDEIVEVIKKKQDGVIDKSGNANFIVSESLDGNINNHRFSQTALR